MLPVLIAASLGQAEPIVRQRGYRTPDQVARAIERCRVGPVSSRDDPDLQEEVYTVAPPGRLTNEQIACIDRAAGDEEVELPSEAKSKLAALQEARWKPVAQANAHQWLSNHKLLGRLPIYKPGPRDETRVAAEIETLCRARRALSSSYGPHTLSPDWMMPLAGRPVATDGPLTCILNVTTALDYQLGFIGNEQMSAPPK